MTSNLETKYVCEYCNKSYKKQAWLKKHLLTHHVNGGGSGGQLMSAATASSSSIDQHADEDIDSQEQVIEHQINQLKL